MDCRDVERFIHAYIDGEFDEREDREMEEHLRSCSACRDIYSFEVWFQSGMRKVRGRSLERAPARLVTGISRKLGQSDRTTPLTGLLRAVPVLAATAFLLTLTWTATHGSTQVVEDAVSRHTRNLPLEVRSPDPIQVQAFLKDKLPFAVRIPTFHDRRIALMGARLSSLRDRDAAYLMYDAGGGKVSMFVFPGRDVEFREARAYHVGPGSYFISKARGYNVVSWKRRGMVYSLISDLDEAELIRLASMAEGW